MTNYQLICIVIQLWHWWFSVAWCCCPKLDSVLERGQFQLSFDIFKWNWYQYGPKCPGILEGVHSGTYRYPYKKKYGIGQYWKYTAIGMISAGSVEVHSTFPFLRSSIFGQVTTHLPSFSVEWPAQTFIFQSVWRQVITFPNVRENYLLNSTRLWLPFLTYQFFPRHVGIVSKSIRMDKILI